MCELGHTLSKKIYQWPLPKLATETEAGVHGSPPLPGDVLVNSYNR